MGLVDGVVSVLPDKIEPQGNGGQMDAFLMPSTKTVNTVIGARR